MQPDIPEFMNLIFEANDHGRAWAVLSRNYRHT